MKKSVRKWLAKDAGSPIGGVPKHELPELHVQTTGFDRLELALDRMSRSQKNDSQAFVGSPKARHVTSSHSSYLTDDSASKASHLSTDESRTSVKPAYTLELYNDNPHSSLSSPTKVVMHNSTTPLETSELVQFQLYVGGEDHPRSCSLDTVLTDINHIPQFPSTFDDMAITHNEQQTLDRILNETSNHNKRLYLDEINLRASSIDTIRSKIEACSVMERHLIQSLDRNYNDSKKSLISPRSLHDGVDRNADNLRLSSIDTIRSNFIAYSKSEHHLVQLFDRNYSLSKTYQSSPVGGISESPDTPKTTGASIDDWQSLDRNYSGSITPRGLMRSATIRSSNTIDLHREDETQMFDTLDRAMYIMSKSQNSESQAYVPHSDNGTLPRPAHYPPRDSQPKKVLSHIPDAKDFEALEQALDRMAGTQKDSKQAYVHSPRIHSRTTSPTNLSIGPQSSPAYSLSTFGDSPKSASFRTVTDSPSGSPKILDFKLPERSSSKTSASRNDEVKGRIHDKVTPRSSTVSSSSLTYSNECHNRDIHITCRKDIPEPTVTMTASENLAYVFEQLEHDIERMSVSALDLEAINSKPRVRSMELPVTSTSPTDTDMRYFSLRTRSKPHSLLGSIPENASIESIVKMGTEWDTAVWEPMEERKIHVVVFDSDEESC